MSTKAVAERLASTVTTIAAFLIDLFLLVDRTANETVGEPVGT
jgi:hypothetical protein